LGVKFAEVEYLGNVATVAAMNKMSVNPRKRGRAREGDEEKRANTDEGSVRLSEGVRTTVPLREAKAGEKGKGLSNTKSCGPSWCRKVSTLDLSADAGLDADHVVFL